jgi:hypothetical protein
MRLCFNSISCAKENGFVTEPCSGEPLQKINSREISRQCVAHYISATRGAGLPPQPSPTRCECDGGLQAYPLTGQAHAQAGESVRGLWRQARSCFPSSLGPSLLPQGLQGQLSCKIRERACAHEKVVRLLCSRNGVARAGAPIRGARTALAPAVGDGPFTRRRNRYRSSPRRGSH